MSPPRTPTQPGQDTTDEVARDRTDRLERDMRDVEARLSEVAVAQSSVATEVRGLRADFVEHRSNSTTQHGATQSAIADLAKRVDALAARLGGQDGPGGSGSGQGSSTSAIAAVPPAVWGGVGTMLAAILAGLAMAMGWAAPPKPPDPVVVPHRQDAGGTEPTP